MEFPMAKLVLYTQRSHAKDRRVVIKTHASSAKLSRWLDGAVRHNAGEDASVCARVRAGWRVTAWVAGAVAGIDVDTHEAFKHHQYSDDVWLLVE
jgi:hypothetical protein